MNQHNTLAVCDAHKALQDAKENLDRLNLGLAREALEAALRALSRYEVPLRG